MNFNSEDEAEILRLFRSNPKRFSPFKAGRATGLTTSQVFEIIEKNKETLARSGERYDGYGRPELRKHLVARRRAMGEQWDNKTAALVAARAQFELGTHILTSGRDGPWLLLYSIERSGRAQPKPGYFNMEKS